MTDDLDKLARRLTDAQRRNLEGAWYGPRGWRVPNASAPMQRIGLTNGVRLTPLGLALKAHIEGPTMSDTLLSNRVTERPKTGDTLWLVSASWRGGCDKRPFLLENVHRTEAAALADWERLTPENHRKNHQLPEGTDCGFVRHPLRVFHEAIAKGEG